MSVGTIIGLLLVGLIAGLLSSMVGIGGGIIVVVSLVSVFGLSQKVAQGTSLAMLLPPIGVLGVMVYHKAGNVKWEYVGLMIITFIVGSYLGSKWVQGMNTILVKRIFAVFLIIIAVKYLFFDKTIKTTPSDKVNSDSAFLINKKQQ